MLLLFQPAEETIDGGAAYLWHTYLDHYNIRAIFRTPVAYAV